MPNLPMSVLTVPTEIEGEVVPTSYEIKDATARAGVSATVDLLDDTVGWIGKNKIPFPYNLSDVSGSGITFTAYANGVVDADGTTSGVSSLYFSRRDGVAGNKMLLPAGTWKVVGGKSINTYLSVGCTENNAYKLIGTDTGNGFVFTLTEPTYIQISLDIYNTTVSHEKISPMVCTVEEYALDDTYEPYHGSVEEVKADKSSVISALNDTVGFIGGNIIINKQPSTTKNGLTITRNADDSFTISGTATADTYIGGRDALYTDQIKAGRYAFSGCPHGGSGLTYFVFARRTSTTTAEFGNDTGEGVVFTLPEDNYLFYFICIKNGVTVNNLVFKPMILTEEQYNLNPTYRPYHESVEEILDTVNGNLKYRNVRLQDVSNEGSVYDKVVNVANQLDELVTDIGVKFSGYVLWTQSMFLRVEAIRCNATTLLYTIFNVSYTIYNGAVQNGVVTVYKFEGTQMTS